MYICPICKAMLNLNGKSYRCEKNHSFDIARQGYVNLLTTVKHNPKNAGDNADMVKARTDFLDEDYYLPLAEKAGEILGNISQEIIHPIIVDSGCGEGYYTINYAKIVPKAEFYGIDISKSAVSHCAGRGKLAGLSNTHFAVASSFDLPFADNFAHIVTSTFAPVCDDEYARVLKSGGKLVVISPTEKHLFGLKEVLYDQPYENKPNEYGLKNFQLTNEFHLEYEILLRTNNDIQNLFTMTPYYYKTSLEAKAKLNELDCLSTLCGFSIQTYTKK